MSNARKSAAARLAEMGLPKRRDEYWKFTRPDLLTTDDVAPAAIVNDDQAPMFAGIERLKIVFVDGIYDADQSDDLALEGVEILPLTDALNDAGYWAAQLYSKLEERGQSPVKRPLATLNSAKAEQGVTIWAKGMTSKPISLVYLRKSDSCDAMLHHLVKLDKGAELTVMEHGSAAARLNTVMEIDVADGAAFHHVRAQGLDHERRAATHMFGQLGSNSVFKSFTMVENGRLTRNEIVLDMNGNDSVAHVAGAVMGQGDDFLQDDTIFITHHGLNCESRQVFKKVLRDGATGVFQGKIYVHPEAQKTDGYQMSQSLLLDGDSQYYGKPELEIYADDVLCSHGSTTGAIDDEAMFYLRSRGVNVQDAQDLLVLAFLASAIDEVENEDLGEDIRAHITAALARRRA